MAELNGGPPSSPPSKLPTTMAKLDDDLILEIVARLPPKNAVQCSLLNKNLRRWISQPIFARRTAALSSSTIFHCSSKNPKIFTRFSSEIESAAAPLPDSAGVSVTLGRETIIMASCNGLLLLNFGPSYSHYVFNPATAGITFVDYPIDGHVGLAVDFAADDYHFKLVTLDVVNQAVLRFSIVVPTARSSGPTIMVLKSQVDFVRQAPTAADDEIQPVYAHGSLYWLGDGGRTTVAFDVEKQQPRIISGPINSSEDRAGDKWFGFADGSVQFVYALAEEIVICGHDHRKGEWRVKHRIPTLSNPSNNDYGNGEPLFFDGGRLFFFLRKRGEDGHVYVYHVSRDEWEKSWSMDGWTDSKQLFFSFSPTIAKVSSLHLINRNSLVWENAAFRDAFCGLQQLLRPITN